MNGRRPQAPNTGSHPDYFFWDPRRPKGQQFAVIISADVLNDHLQTVLVCPLVEAPQMKESRMGATLIPKEVIGMERDVVVFSLQIKTIGKNQIVKRISSVPPNYLGQIKESLLAVLDIHI